MAPKFAHHNLNSRKNVTKLVVEHIKKTLQTFPLDKILPCLLLSFCCCQSTLKNLLDLWSKIISKNDCFRKFIIVKLERESTSYSSSSSPLSSSSSFCSSALASSSAWCSISSSSWPSFSFSLLSSLSTSSKQWKFINLPILSPMLNNSLHYTLFELD